MSRAAAFPKEVEPQLSLDSLLQVITRSISDAAVALDEKKQPAIRDIPILFPMLRGLFKADHPFRTKLPLSGVWNTSSAGVVNIQTAVGGITGCSEWTSIDALFDEFFVHSMVVYFFPYNRNATIPPASASWSSPAMGLLTTTTEQTAVYNSGATLVALYNAPSYYSSQAAMCSSPTRKFVQTSEKFSYAWKNNVRFDARGYALNAGSNYGWQGWTSIAAAANYGGAVQIRAVDDTAYGDGSHTLNLGSVTVLWDVSFRARG